MTTLIQRKRIYDEFIDFIAQGANPEDVTKFQFSESTKEQIEDIVDRAKNGDLTKEEQQELDELLVVEHLITLTKAKAYKHIQSKSE